MSIATGMTDHESTGFTKRCVTPYYNKEIKNNTETIKNWTNTKLLNNTKIKLLNNKKNSKWNESKN